MGWLKKLEAAAGARSIDPAVAPPPSPLPEVHQVTVSVRGQSGNDPGEIAIGYFTFEGGRLLMTDENGKPDGAPIIVNPDVDPRAIARAETAKRWRGDVFNRPLGISPSGRA